VGRVKVGGKMLRASARVGTGRKGRGGAKKGHEFYGNQYTKVAKYARRGLSKVKSGARRAGSFWKRNRKSIARKSVVGAAGFALGSVMGGR
jgi:hypothetical protein